MKATTSFLVLAASASNLYADYPIASHRYLADPSSLVTKDRVYIYCSNDDESPVEGGFNIPNVVCISTSDMKNWTDHGIVFDAAGETKWAKKTWAPCAIERDGKFFLYFGNGGKNIGVVAGESPAGPFKDVLGKPFIEHGTPGVQPAKDMWLFDPGVFIDDDGQAYIYFGGNGDTNVRAATLKKDMVTLDGEVIKMNAPNFFEATWVWKKDGKYYFSYSTTPKAEMRIDYMTGDSPLNFKYAGIVAAQPPINNNNNHAVEFEFKGRWFHVYHNRIVATEAKIPTGFRRNIAAEEFTYDDKGAIKQVEYTTDGIKQLGRVDPFKRVEAETFALQKDIETEPCSAGGMNLTNIEKGDWITTGRVDSDLLTTRNTLTQRTFGPECSGTTALDLTRMKDGDFAGLAMLQKRYGLIGAKREGDKLSIVMVSAQSDSPVELAKLPLDQKKILLRADCDFKERADTTRFFYSLDDKDWQEIGEPLKMSYTMPHFIGYRFGLFNFATKKPGGSMDFAYFRITEKLAR